MLTLKPVATVALAVSLGAVAPPPVEAPVLDGHGPPALSESAHSFNCPNIRATVKYRQERFDPDSVRLENSLRVTLLELTVAGASLRPDQLASASELFRSFASVRDVSASCYRDTVTIDIRGMPLRPFIDAIRNDTPLPEVQTRTLHLNASGLVTRS